MNVMDENVMRQPFAHDGLTGTQQNDQINERGDIRRGTGHKKIADAIASASPAQTQE